MTLSPLCRVVEWRYKYRCEIPVVGSVGQGLSLGVDCPQLLTGNSIYSFLHAAGQPETPAAHGQLALSPVPTTVPFCLDYLSQSFHTPPAITLLFPPVEPQLSVCSGRQPHTLGAPKPQYLHHSPPSCVLGSTHLQLFCREPAPCSVPLSSWP